MQQRDCSDDRELLPRWRIAVPRLLLGSSLAWSLCLACPAARPDEPAASSADPPPVSHYGYKVVKSYPHDRRFFTQGLVYEDGFLYEGTGLYGQSALYSATCKRAKP